MQALTVSRSCSGRNGLAMKSWAPLRIASEINLVWFKSRTHFRPSVLPHSRARIPRLNRTIDVVDSGGAE